MEAVNYAINESIGVDEFRALLVASTLGERRPIDDDVCLRAMLEHSNLLVTARSAGRLVGVARSVTDFAYCCYLSDLAVARDLQKSGIGKELIRRTQAQLGPRCTLILLSAPAAVDYYPHVGFDHHPQAWVLKPGMPVR